jgi:hypothetical protein
MLFMNATRQGLTPVSVLPLSVATGLCVASNDDVQPLLIRLLSTLPSLSASPEHPVTSQRVKSACRVGWRPPDRMLNPKNSLNPVRKADCIWSQMVRFVMVSSKPIHFSYFSSRYY